MVTLPNAEFRFNGSLPTYGVRVGQRVWIENALRDIERNGEWAYDPRSNSIYVLPASRSEPEVFEVSKALEGLVLSGVKNILVQDISFTQFRDNAVRIDGGIDIALKTVSISNIGGTALRLNGRNVVADDFHVFDTGASGVSVSGGDRRALTRGNVFVSGCRIERVGQLRRAYTPAVGIAGVGNGVINCRLSDGPHAAIVFHGNDHLIERNLIERFVLETDDAGAIYTGRDWTERRDHSSSESDKRYRSQTRKIRC